MHVSLPTREANWTLGVVALHQICIRLYIVFTPAFLLSLAIPRLTMKTLEDLFRVGDLTQGTLYKPDDIS